MKKTKDISNLLRCIKSNVRQNWTAVLIVFVIYLITGPISTYFSYQNSARVIKDGIEREKQSYEAAMTIIEQMKDPGKAKAWAYEKFYDSFYANRFEGDPDSAMKYAYAADPAALYDGRIKELSVRMDENITSIFYEGRFYFSIFVSAVLAYFMTSYFFAFDKGRKNTDFYGALPVRRTEQYISAVACTYVFIMAPMIVNAFLSVAVLTASGAVQYIGIGKITVYALRSILSHALYVFDFMACAVISCVIGNTWFVSMISYISVNFYYVAFVWSASYVSEIGNSCLADLISELGLMEDIAKIVSPAMRLIINSESTVRPSLDIWWMQLIYFALSSSVLVLGWYLFGKRKAENSVVPCAFKKLRYVFQYCTMLISAILFSVLLSAFFNGSNIVSLICFVFVGCFIAFICINSICEGSVRQMFRRSRHLFILMGVVIAVMILFLDPFKLFAIPDPDENNITSMKVTFGETYRIGDMTLNDPVILTNSRDHELIAAICTEISNARKTGMNYGASFSPKGRSYEYMVSAPDNDSGRKELTDKFLNDDQTKSGFMAKASESGYFLNSTDAYYPVDYNVLVLVEVKYLMFTRTYYLRYDPYGVSERFRETFGRLWSKSLRDGVYSRLGDYTDGIDLYVSSVYDGAITAGRLVSAGITYNGYEKYLGGALPSGSALDKDAKKALAKCLKRDAEECSLSDISASGKTVLVISAPGSFDLPGTTRYLVIPDAFKETLGFIASLGVQGTDSAEKVFAESVIGVEKYDGKRGAYVFCSELYEDYKTLEGIKTEKLREILENAVVLPRIPASFFVDYDALKDMELYRFYCAASAKPGDELTYVTVCAG